MSFDEPDGPPDATDDELALSAYLDGLASPAERARVDADPVLVARLSRYRAVAALLAEERTAALTAGEAAAGAAGGAATGADREPALEAALDRARVAALAAVATPSTPGGRTHPAGRFTVRPPARQPRGGTGRRGRWAVQVVGLAAALLVAVGAVALFGSGDDDGSAGVESAEAPTTTPAGAAFGAQEDSAGRDTSASGAEDDSSDSSDNAERAVTAQAAEAAPSGAGAPLLAAPPPALGNYATVEELVAQLSPVAAPTTTWPGPTTTSTVASAPAPAPAAAAGGATCAPPSATVVGTATVAGRAVLVTEVTDGNGLRRLVGLDPLDCAPVFDRPR